MFALWTYIWIRHGGNAWQAMLLIGGGYALWCLYISRQTITITDEGIKCQRFLFPSESIAWTEVNSVHLTCNSLVPILPAVYRNVNLNCYTRLLELSPYLR